MVKINLYLLNSRSDRSKVTGHRSQVTGILTFDLRHVTFDLQ